MRDYSSPNLLVNVREKGRPVEVKHVAVSAAQPNLMALAAGDAFARIYDRRMLSPGAGRGAQRDPASRVAFAGAEGAWLSSSRSRCRPR